MLLNVKITHFIHENERFNDLRVFQRTIAIKMNLKRCAIFGLLRLQVLPPRAKSIYGWFRLEFQSG